MRYVAGSEAVAGRRRAAAWLAVAAAASVLAASGPGTPAEEGKGGAAKAALPADLAWVSPEASGLLSVRLADLWDHAAFKAARAEITKEAPEAAGDFEKVLGAPPAGVERLTVVMPRMVPGNVQPLFYVRTARPYDAKKVLAALGPDAKEEKRGGRVLHASAKERRAVTLLDDRCYVVGETGEVQSLLDRGPAKAAGALTPALEAAAASHAAVLAANPGPTMAVVGDKLPAEAEPFRPLLEAKGVVLTVDADKWVQAVLRFQYSAEAKAKEGAKALQALSFLAQNGIDKGIEMWGKDKDYAKVVELLKEGKTALQAARVEAQGSAVQLAASIKTDLSATSEALLGTVQKVRGAAARTQGANNLKQIALAMHNYHSVYNRFPPAAVYDKDGKPLLSWRVLILPYIEQEKLYKEFHLDEPWDSEHNKKLLAKMPKTFAAPDAEAKPGETHYLGFVGKGAFFEGKKGTTIADITDGTSNTIMVVEAAKSVPWTKPEDLPFDPDKELPKVGFRKGVFQAAFADGSVRAMSPTISKKTLKAAITRNGGEVLGNDF
jgi:hypothetical protein